jgi:ubiquinone biosynthesis protein
MAISLKPEHLKRYKDVAWLLWKYGRGDWLEHAGFDLEIEDEPAQEASSEEPAAAELADDLERLGPTFIKLGQLLSTRADLLPVAYLEALARLQDEVEPVPYGEIEPSVERELGVKISKAFIEFDPKPVAAASLGQVHRATLRDGRVMAVKVQRPGIRKRILEDLEALAEMARVIDERTEWGRRFHTADILDEFRGVLLRELDYRREATNLRVLRENLARFEQIVVPAPIEDYTTDRVLTMEWVSGRKVTDLSPLAQIELDGGALAEQLFEAYLQQVLVDGVFHADPHPGNVFVTDDGRLALLDLGMTAHLGTGMQEQLLKLLLAVSEGQGEDAAQVAIDIGEIDPARFDERTFRRRVVDLVGQYGHATFAEIEVGKIVLEISSAASEGGVRVPRELSMLGKALLNLDSVGRALAPDFDPNATIRRLAGDITTRRMMRQASPGKILSSVLETAEFARKLPGRVNRILDVIANNQLEIKVDTIDEATLVVGFQKVANRIATGLVLAALIVGAAMLMQVETDFVIFGYPGLAMLCFLAAAGGGLALLVAILLHDRPREGGRAG